MLEKFANFASGIKYRSNALNPLWPIFLILGAITVAAFATRVGWIIAFTISIVLVFLVFFMICYTYFMITNPDHLKSEKYNIKKLELEQRAYGDSSQDSLLNEKDFSRTILIQDADDE